MKLLVWKESGIREELEKTQINQAEEIKRMMEERETMLKDILRISEESRKAQAEAIAFKSLIDGIRKENKEELIQSEKENQKLKMDLEICSAEKYTFFLIF